MAVQTSEYMEQTPPLTLHEVAELLWAHGEHAAYRAVMAYVKERDNAFTRLKELEHGAVFGSR